MTMREKFLYTMLTVSLIWGTLALIWPVLVWFVLPLLAIWVIGLYDMWQTRHTVLRLYPFFGHFRYIFESIRPEIQQYFVEDDTNGVPVSREFRSLIYQRAKGQNDNRPFGTLFDTYRVGYEWTLHSLQIPTSAEKPSRIMIGADRCQHPYSASRFNISAMSYGAISPHAIKALNRAAHQGGFYQNTGEGGLSPYHLEEGGDLVWQIGTGYFSCRNREGSFNREEFAKRATEAAVKMIEVKLSQGAKPGHGGVLPAAKVNDEIAKIRIVEKGQDVISPPTHSAFSTPVGLLEFVTELRELSGGKPVGFKMSIGHQHEFYAICKAMLATGLRPDFITIDGAEGGTAAAPVEFTNSVGTPLRDALHFVNNTLIGFGLRDDLKLIASGKAFSSFHVLRLMALGADMVNSARGMMFALGCIQSRSCHTDKCPTGIATQNPDRYQQLNIADKAKRVKQYQASVIKNLQQLAGAIGLDCPSEMNPNYLLRRISVTEVKNYAELFPIMQQGCLQEMTCVPEQHKKVWQQASAYSWRAEK